MPIALNVHVQVQDDTLVLTDHAGKTVTFSKEHTVQKKGSMMTRGELCGLPQRQRAASFGFKTRQSSYDIRNAVLTGAPEDLWPTRTGPPTPSKRTKEIEGLSIRTRFETAGTMYEIAETFTPQGFSVSARVVGRILADDGLSKKNAPHRAPFLPGSLPQRRSKSSMGPTSRGHASSPGMTSSTT
jgi:hypothetical protein